MDDFVYLAGDVDAIKDFVFETSSLPQIRGGSELLQECEEEIKRRYGPAAVIYCAGGSFLLKLPPQLVGAVRREIQQVYRDRTLAATVTIVSEEGDPVHSRPPTEIQDGWAGRLCRAAAGIDGNFGLRMAALAARMREAKTMPYAAPFYEALPFGRRCERCGKRMATSREPVQQPRWLCLVCERRDSTGRTQRKQIHGTDVRGRFNQRFWEKHGRDLSARQPEDLDTLVEEAGRDYLALLYADGNDIGRLLQSLRREEEYRLISNALIDGTQQALYDALVQVCRGALTRQRYWPFDIVNVGGDDVTVLVQASYAWELAVEFLSRFEQEVNGRISAVGGEGRVERVTASCGIAIADARYPVRYLERLATSVLKDAKRVAKSGDSGSRSAISFLWLPSPVAADTADSLLGEYTVDGAGAGAVSLLARPYTLDQAKDLTQVVAKMAQWSHSLRQRWAAALTSGVMPSTALIAYDIARLRDSRRQELLSTLQRLAKLLDQAGRVSSVEPPVWMAVADHSGGRTWKTALFDALELAALHSLRPDVQVEE